MVVDRLEPEKVMFRDIHFFLWLADTKKEGVVSSKKAFRGLRKHSESTFQKLPKAIFSFYQGSAFSGFRERNCFRTTATNWGG